MSFVLQHSGVADLGAPAHPVPGGPAASVAFFPGTVHPIVGWIQEGRREELARQQRELERQAQLRQLEQARARFAAD